MYLNDLYSLRFFTIAYLLTFHISITNYQLIKTGVRRDAT